MLEVRRVCLIRGTVTAACAIALTGAFATGTAGAATFTGSNPAALTPADNGAPAASAITVTGLGSSVTSASITLSGVTHQAASDLDILLVSPGGVKSLLVSDACGGGAVSALNITLTDSAAAPIPENGCASTSYRPQDYVGNVLCEPDGADVFDPPAPMGIDADNFAAFAGKPGNGAWNLYVQDSCLTSTGTVAGGWSLTVNGTDPPANAPANKKKCKKKKRKGKGKAGIAAKKKCKKKKTK